MKIVKGLLMAIGAIVVIFAAIGLINQNMAKKKAQQAAAIEAAKPVTLADSIKEFSDNQSYSLTFSLGAPRNIRADFEIVSGKKVNVRLMNKVDYDKYLASKTMENLDYVKSLSELDTLAMHKSGTIPAGAYAYVVTCPNPALIFTSKIRLKYVVIANP